MTTIKTPVDYIDTAVQSIDSDVKMLKARRAVLKSGKTRTMLSKLLQPLIYAVGDAGSMYVSVFAGKPTIYVTMYGLDSLKQRELVWSLEHLTNETEKLGGKVSSSDYAELVNRDYSFTTDKWEARIEIGRASCRERV